MNIENTAADLVILLSILLMTIFAFRSFALHEIKFDGALVAPNLLTNRLYLSSGFIFYWLLVMLSYTVITYYWGPMSKIVAPYLKDTPLEKLVGDGNRTPDAIVPLVVACAAAWALVWDAKYNPFRIMLEFALDLIRVPDKASTTLEQLRAAKFRRPSPEEAAAIAAGEDISYCKVEDFRLERKDLLYRWAHLCHLRYLLFEYLRDDPERGHAWINRHRRGAQVITRLKWADLDKSYRDLAPRFGTWRQSADRDLDEAIEIFSAINDLKEKHYRLLACLIVCESGSEHEIWERLQQLSRDPVQPVPGDLTLYLILFCVSVFASILIGRELSILLYLNLIGPSDKILHFDIDRLKFWVSVSLLIYTPPIALMFAFRRWMRDRFPFNKQRYWGVYASFGLLAFLVTILILPELRFDGHALQWFSVEYWRRVWDDLLWGMMPCFLTGMVAYRMDSPASGTDLPRDVLLDRARIALICAAAGGVFSFLGALGSSTLSFPEKFVVVCTVTLLGGASGWLSRFKT
jgi:hypothetical protein